MRKAFLPLDMHLNFSVVTFRRRAEVVVAARSSSSSNINGKCRSREGSSCGGYEGGRNQQAVDHSPGQG